ncbi:hypothetical protein O181_089782 [Austropuccinia psidii MF-1]|uniref:Uncharacterized protein n=1 Tax=Austropuccinia psidii MF-1 TaxID=1389203 RepID=A0A9Q3IU84_9BASI|nr:hypothetical protein [Austropuccinia psidii MF-1]
MNQRVHILLKNTISTPRQTLKPHKRPPAKCLTSIRESSKPIEALNIHESGTIQLKSDIGEIKSSIQATAHCTPAFLVPHEQFPLITDPDIYD